MNELTNQNIKTYTDGGIIVFNMPKVMDSRQQREFLKSTNEFAEKLGNPRPLIVVIPHGVTIQSLSADDLAKIGLYRL